MMDGYQAIYDAVRSKMSGGNIEDAVERAITSIGIDHHAQQVSARMLEVTYSYERPSVLFRPRVFPDGDKWCALYGDNIQDGVCGFGDTPHKACISFDLAWLNRAAAPEYK